MKTLLSATIANQVPVLITGAPGIGKSDIVAQAAVAAGASMILSHPAVADPTDAKGLPWVVDGKATFLPFGELHQALTATTRTVWFLDDLGQATPAVQASYMQLLLARRVNGHRISDTVTFVAATNRRVDRAGVSGILEPVKSRFGTIVELEPDIDDWCTWAIDRAIAIEIIAFLRFQPDLLCKFAASADLTNSPVPRTWAAADRILSLSLPPAIQHAALSGAIGDAAATELTAFLRLYHELPSVDQILIDPDSVPVPVQPATLYALSGALAHRTNDQTFGRIAQYIDRMVRAGKGEFGALVLKDALQRCPTVTKTTAFVKLATSDLGQLISGR
jgi:MoxR-like ATPase